MREGDVPTVGNVPAALLTTIKTWALGSVMMHRDKARIEFTTPEEMQ